MSSPQARMRPGHNCAVAAELVRRGLAVTVIDDEDASRELDAVLPQARHLGPVIVNRDACNGGCQLSGEDWADIGDDAGAGRAADMAAALLNSLAPQAELIRPMPDAT